MNKLANVKVSGELCGTFLLISDMTFDWSFFVKRFSGCRPSATIFVVSGFI